MDTWMVSPVGKIASLLFTGFFMTSGMAGAVPFYRFPESEIPSGEMHLRHLKPDGTEAHKAWVKIKWGEHESQQGWVPRSSVLMDLDLTTKAVTIGHAPYFYQANTTSNPVGHLPVDTTLEIRSRKDNWVKAILPDHPHKSRGFWIEERYLKASPLDGGRFMAVMTTGAREKPALDGKVVFHLSEGSIVRPIKIRESWALIQLKRKKGWINLHDVVSKTEFADQVLHRGSWKPCLGRTGRWVALPKGVFVNLTDISAIRTNPAKAILQNKVLKVRAKPSTALAPVIQTLGFGQRLSVADRQTIRWKHAYTSEYGSIWWSVPVDAQGREIATVSTKAGMFSTDEVFSRGIFDMAANSQFPTVRYVSAGGVFKTTDEINWKQITFFGNKNYPLALSSSGVLYVGPYLSRNGGRSFSPYLRWDRIVARYMKSQGRVPQRMTLTKIDTDEWSGAVTVTLSSGLHQWKLRSSDSGLRWNPVPDQTPPKAAASRNPSTRSWN
jgi:hypothetical protein